MTRSSSATHTLHLLLFVPRERGGLEVEMEIYYDLIGFSILLTVLYKCCEMYNLSSIKIISKRVKTINIENLLLPFCFIIYFIIMSFRNYDVGTDYKLYLIRFIEIGRTPFERLIDVSDNFSFEYGFTFFNKLIYHLTQDPLVFSMITSSIICYGFYKFIKSYSDDKLFSFFIFVCYCIGTNAMNTMRQYISIAILLLTLSFLQERKLLKYFIGVMLATSFHTSSIVFLLLYPLYMIKQINIRYVLTILGITLVIALFGDKLFYPLIERTSFAWYIDKGNGTGFNMLFFLIAVFIFTVFYSSDSFRKSQNFRLWINMLSLCILFNACAIHLGIFERMMRSFSPALLILIPNCLDSRKYTNVNKIIRVSAYIFFIFYFSYMMKGTSGSGNTNDYVFLNTDTFRKDIEELHFDYYRK